MLTLLLGFLGLVIDVGIQYSSKRRMQSAADAGAMAGAHDLERQRPSDQAISSAKKDVEAFGYTDDTDGATVTVNHPPASGPRTGDLNAVEVIVRRKSPTLLMRVLGQDSASVKARAVAGLVGGRAVADVLVLDPHAPSACSVSGSGRLELAGGLMVNSDHSRALTATGSASLTAGSISVTGNYSGCCYQPSPETGVPPIPDPLAHVPAPAYAPGCDATNLQIPSATTRTLYPGRYCGGITIHSGATVTMMPGTYILVGGGLTLSGGATLTGHDVCIYLTYQNPDGSDYRGFNFSGDGRLDLSAPTTGPQEGILFFQDRTAPPGRKNVLSGSTSMVMTGALYSPTELLEFSGSSGTVSLRMMWVVGTLRVSGSANIRNDYAGGLPSPARVATLVE